MTETDRLEQAREAFERRAWGKAFAELSAAHREGKLLDVEDLEELAVAAYMVGKEDDCAEAWLRAHQAWLRRGAEERAARCGSTVVADEAYLRESCSSRRPGP